jgi:hypothetical protein
MISRRVLDIFGCVVVLLAAKAAFAQEVESGSVLKKLPPGLVLEGSTVAPADQLQAIGKKLGGQLERLTNSQLTVHGRGIQVNLLLAADETSAAAILESLHQIKPHPFAFRTGRQVVEYVGESIDEALALKTSYELGLMEKPRRVRYQVIAQLATVDSGDYMACNPLFNAFLAAESRPGGTTTKQIKDLSAKLEFGNSLTLRHPKLFDEPSEFQFDPQPAQTTESSNQFIATFENLPNKFDVPYTTATLQITVDESGLVPADEPGPELVAATVFWPADDPAIRKLAEQITAGKSSNGAKALAILQWLAPGKNVKYSGKTGSRWGSATVFEQRFGHCWDFSDCFVTLCRAAGVPARQVAGWFYGSAGHVWAEFYREGKGWQQVDPTGGGELRCGIYHIPYFTTDDGQMPIVYVAMPKIQLVSSEPPDVHR